MYKSFFIKHKSLLIPFLLGIILFVILRIPSLFEPHYYGDEGIYASVAQELHFGERLYTDIWDNKFPLIYLLYQVVGQTNTLLYVRILNFVAALLSIVAVFAIFRKLFTNHYLSLILYLLFILLLGTPLLEGNIANSENFLLPFMLWSLVIGLYLKKSSRYRLLMGLFMGIAFLFKFTAIFEVFAICVYLLITQKFWKDNKRFLKAFQYLLPIGIGFIIPVLLQILYIFNQGIWHDFFTTTILGMFQYVSWSGYTQTWWNVLLQSIIFKVGSFLILLLLIVYLHYKKKITTQNTLFFLLYSSSLFIITLSIRYYTHYLLQALLSFTLFVGLLLSELLKKQPKINKLYIIIPVLIGISIPILLYSENIPVGTTESEKTYYYLNFYNYKITQTITFEEYDKFFHSEETRIRSLKKSLKELTSNSDSIYIYTDSGWTYRYLNLRIPTPFAVSYHWYISSDGSTRLLTALENTKPTIIVVDRHIERFKLFDTFLQNQYTEVLANSDYIFYVKR